MGKIYIDAEGAAMGRVGSLAAKSALLGDEVSVLNCEKAIVSGNEKASIKWYLERRALGGSALKGPFFSKDTEKMMKRCIRGMLPSHKSGRGRDAWRRIKCYNGIPEEFKKEKMIKPEARAPEKHITLKELKQLI